MQGQKIDIAQPGIAMKLGVLSSPRFVGFRYIDVESYNYLINVVWGHPAARVVFAPWSYADISYNDTQYYNRLMSRASFLERFLDDPQCPQDARRVLEICLGSCYANLKEGGLCKNFEYRKFFMQRWIDKCR